MPVIDAHAHLDPRLLDPGAMLAKMDRCGIDKVALIPAMNDPLPRTPFGLLAALRALLRSPLHRLARPLNDRLTVPGEHVKLRGQLVRIYGLPDNDTVASLLRSHPDRFLGWIFLNPARMPDPLSEFDRWRQVPGFVGVKLHPHWHGWPIEAALPIARRCEELGLPILIHLGFAERGRFGLLVDRCPRLRLVLAHAAMPWWDRAWPDIARNPSLFVDVSSPYLSERLVRRAVDAVGPDRALFGTDAPYGFHEPDGSYDYGHVRGWVERLPLRSGEIDRVLGGNVVRLLGEARMRAR
jgi:predicted TIM-barrel fold metal-dependent hydrolase